MVSPTGDFLGPDGHIEFAGHPTFIEVQHVDPLSAVVAAENRDAAWNLRFIYLGVHDQEGAAFMPSKSRAAMECGARHVRVRASGSPLAH